MNNCLFAMDAEKMLLLVGTVWFLSLPQARCQLTMGAASQVMNLDFLRNDLTRVVKFVVGDTAVPSIEMLYFGRFVGAEPPTQMAKDTYLDMMKGVARKTPEVVEQFSSMKNINGVPTKVLDEIKLDAHITKKGLEYQKLLNVRNTRTRERTEQWQNGNQNMMGMLPMDLGFQATTTIAPLGGAGFISPPGAAVPAAPLGGNQVPTTTYSPWNLAW